MGAFFYILKCYFYGLIKILDAILQIYIDTNTYELIETDFSDVIIFIIIMLCVFYYIFILFKQHNYKPHSLINQLRADYAK